MKLSFTTLGCPDWTLKEIIENASRMGFDGVELRGIRDEMDISRLPEFTEKLEETKRLFSDHGLAVSGIGVSARFAVVDPEDKRRYFDETRRNLRLAAQLGARIVRVFGGAVPEGRTVEDMIPVLAENLRQIAGDAEKCGVTVALETHDDWTSSSVVSEVMKRVNHDYVEVLWDLHHPFRFSNEKPEETYENLSAYVVGVHVKDSVLDERGELRHVPPGEGDVPLRRMLQMLFDGGYDGYVTFEWEKRWHRDLLEPEVVFPKFVEKMREWFG